MKKSEELERKAAQEDNDLVALGILTKAMREKRYEKFNERYLPELIRRYPIDLQEEGTRIRITTEKFGKIDFYPKANKILIHQCNQWKKPGLRWIIQNLLSTDNYENL